MSWIFLLNWLTDDAAPNQKDSRDAGAGVVSRPA